MKDAFAKILTGTLKLHELLMQGKQDGEEYEAVCVEMDSYWYSMTSEEDKRAREFSALLYTVSDYLLGKNAGTGSDPSKYENAEGGKR